MADKWIIDVAYPQGHIVPMTAAEEAQRVLDQQSGEAEAATETARHRNAETMRQELRDRMAQMLTLADALRDNTATPTQQRQALELCLRATVRLARLQMQILDEVSDR